MNQKSTDEIHTCSPQASPNSMMYDETHDEALDPKNPWIQWLMRLDGVK